MARYWQHVGLWLLLSGGACSLASNIAALFGYSGRYTLELVIGCIAFSVLFGAVSCRRASTMPDPPPSRELIKALAYRDATEAQRRRMLFATIAGGVVFLILDFVAYQTTLHLFSHLMPRDLMPQMVIVIALVISGTVAALFGVVLYQRVLPKMFPDKNDSN